MTKKKKNKPRPAPSAPRAQASGSEIPAAEAATVLWMLSLLATLAADLLTAAGWLYFNLTPIGRVASDTARSLPNLMLMTATLTGVVCLALTPLVYKFRSQPPPLAITCVAVFASVAPILTLLFTSLINH